MSVMWSKIYLAVFGFTVAVTAFFTFYSWSWLQSRGNPLDAVAGFEYHSNLSWVALWLSALILLLLANGVLWASKCAWAMWATFAYLAIFLVIHYFWLGEAFFRYKETNNMSDDSISLGPVLGAILIVAAGVVIFANQFITVRLYRKMYPPIVAKDPETAAIEQPSAE